MKRKVNENQLTARNQKMPKIVMFPHSPKEYQVPRQCCQNGNGVCGWNMGKHRRRFLLREGDYVDVANALQTKTDLLFWSEWEANTRVTRLHPAVGQNLATWLYEPQYPIPCPHPVGNDDTHCCQNTDPCVFGDSFKYAVCRQPRARVSSAMPGDFALTGRPVELSSAGG